jgi:hypothetical protein
MSAMRREVERLIDYYTPLMVRACVELGVFDQLRDGPLPVQTVAENCDLDADALRRASRALRDRGLLTVRPDDRLEPTQLGLTLIGGVPGSLAGFASFKSVEVHAWAEVCDVLRTGKPAFPSVFGAAYFDWLSAEPGRAAHFNDTMRRRVATLLDQGLESIDWPQIGTIVDVGGGSGQLIERVLALNPGLHGVIFDLPHVVQEASVLLTQPGFADRATLVSGSFFESVPVGGDVYVLSNILHDWDDRRSGEILRCCRAAMSAGARLRLFEEVLPDGGQPGPGYLMDLHMMVLLGGRERTRGDWDALLRDAGFAITRVIPTPGISWIEAVIPD